MSTPLSNKTTISSRNKMALLNSIGNHYSHNNNNHHHHQHPATNTIAKTATKPLNPTTRLPPKTTIKPIQKTIQPQVPATSSRIAVPRSRLTGSGGGLPQPTATTTNQRIAGGLTTNSKGTVPSSLSRGSSTTTARASAFSRSSSKVSSGSSAHTNSLARLASNAQLTSTTVKKQPSIPDTNVVRKGLAKFSNPIECQRQFQALSTKIRQLTEINENKEKEITRLQDRLKTTLNFGIGYATTVQYFAKKLKLDCETDLETECKQLKCRIDELLVNERDYENRLESIISDYKNQLQVEQDLRENLSNEFEEAKLAHKEECKKLIEAHRNELEDLSTEHQDLKEKLEVRIETLEAELENKTKELLDLRKDHEQLNNKFNKLEESLTRDKEARVRYAQEKVNQLQKDVDSLNSVLEMRTERIHALEKESLLLSETQHELMLAKDQNKALKQQLESMNAALDKKREEYENLLADHEKISQELKRERRERRRMTMRTEQLEYVLNESCATESNITAVLDTSVRNMDTSVDRVS